MSRNKELWDNAIEQIDDKYIEETAKTIIKKAGNPIDMNSISSEIGGNIQSLPKKNESRISRALPVVLASAAAIAMVVGAGYILNKYDISMSSTHDATKDPSVTTAAPDIIIPLTVSDELYKLKWGMNSDEIKSQLTLRSDTTINNPRESIIEYREQEIMGNNSTLDIHVSNDEGLYQIVYHIPAKDTALLFSELTSMLKGDGGKYDPIDEDTAHWHYDNRGYSITLMDTGTEIEYRIVPLIPEENRHYTFLREQEEAKRPEYSWKDVNADSIDPNIDFSAVIMEKSEELHRLMHDYLHYSEENLVYELGERIENAKIADTYEVISEEIKTYEDFKVLFEDSIYGEFFDYINTDTPGILEIDGKLCNQQPMSGIIGCVESWYTGYDVMDNNRIVAHYALLKGTEDTGYNSTDHLNNTDNYYFYDIVIQNVDGKYVVTDCYNAETGSNESAPLEHGVFFNLGIADRTRITNEKVKPADNIHTSSIDIFGNRKAVLISDFSNSTMTLKLQQYNVTLLHELDTGFVPGNTGGLKPELYVLNTKSGRLLYICTPYPFDEGVIRYNYLLYTIDDDKNELKQFRDSSGNPLILDAGEGCPLLSAGISDTIYIRENAGEERKYYELDYEKAEASEIQLYSVMDSDNSLLNYKQLRFSDIQNNKLYNCFGLWELTLDTMGFAEAGMTFTFDSADNVRVSETDKAWFFTGVIPELGDEAVYVILKSNPDIMYLYLEPSFNDGMKFCNYYEVFKRRTDSSLGKYTIRNFTDFQLLATLEEGQNVIFMTKDHNSDDYILEYDTGIKVNHVTTSDESDRAYIFNLYFGDNKVIMLTVPELRNGSYMFRSCFYKLEKDKITPFTDNNGSVFSVLSRSTDFNAYENADAIKINGFSQDGSEKIYSYLMLDFNNCTATESKVFPEGAETTIELDSKGYNVSAFRENTVKLIISEHDTGKLTAELDTGITCPADKKIKLDYQSMGDDIDLIIMNTDSDNYFFVATKNNILPVIFENGEPVRIAGYALQVRCDNNLNEFWINGSHADERKYYSVDKNTGICTVRQPFPNDKNTDSINAASIMENERVIPESDPFFGKWESSYGHSYPNEVYFSEEGVMCYETDKVWLTQVVYGGEPVSYIIMRDNPDYMYMYSGALHMLQTGSYRFCNYNMVFERGDATEKINISYQTFNGYSVRLTYTEGLKTKLRKLDIMQGGSTNATLELDFEPLSPELDFTFRGIDFNGGNIVAISMPYDNANSEIRLYRCTQDSISEITAYNLNGEEAKLRYSYIDEINKEENSLLFCSSDTIRRRFRIDFDSNTMTEFLLYPIDSDTSVITFSGTPSKNTEILEKVFYGEWEIEYKNDDLVNPGGGYTKWLDPLIFSYMGECIDYPSTKLVNSIYEDEKGWYAVGTNGKHPQICFVAKNDPDTLYFYIHYGDTVTMNEYAIVYKKADANSEVDKITAPARLTHLGVERLAEITGFDIFDPPQSVRYDNAKKWVMGEIYGSGIGEVFLTHLSENKIIYCRRAYPKDNEPTVYPDGYAADYDSFVYLTLTAEKEDGEWKMTSASDKYGKELFNLIDSIDSDVFDAGAEYILNGYTHDEFWDETISPENDRITADAIRKFNHSLNSITDDKMRKNILEDGQLVYSECNMSYWQ